MVTATGFALLPAIIFPRKKLRNIMLNEAPSGSLGLANPSGWMTSELFVEPINILLGRLKEPREDPSLRIITNRI